MELNGDKTGEKQNEGKRPYKVDALLQLYSLFSQPGRGKAVPGMQSEDMGQGGQWQRIQCAVATSPPRCQSDVHQVHVRAQCLALGQGSFEPRSHMLPQCSSETPR